MDDRPDFGAEASLEGGASGAGVVGGDLGVAAAAAAPSPEALASEPAPAPLEVGVPAPPAPYVFVQERPGSGYIMPNAGDAFARPRAVGRFSEWPKPVPKSFSCVCYTHGASKCKGIWPKHRAPSEEDLMAWLRQGPGLTREAHLALRPA